jgi:hypothetical protein
MNKKDKTQKLNAIIAEQDIGNFQSNLNRARSVNVGSCFGGVVEMSMRGNNGAYLWAPLQPIEVVELIHQMAASIGCHINIQPRNDFSSWRQWRETPEEKAQYNHSDARECLMKEQDMKIGSDAPIPLQQPGLQPALMARSESNEQAVATKKTVGRKRTKRASKAS